MHPVLQRFIEQVDDIRDARGLAGPIERAANELDFPYFAYFALHRRSAPAPSPIIVSNFPRAWCDAYFAEGYYNHDPVIIRSIGTNLPFEWLSAFGRRGLNKGARRVLAAACDSGLRNGISVPVHRCDEHLGVFSLVTQRGGSCPSFGDGSFCPAIHALAYRVDHAICRAFARAETRPGRTTFRADDRIFRLWRALSGSPP